MKNGWTCWRVLLLFVAIFVGSASSVRSQDVFREMDQLKKQISDLKSEVANLRSIVYDLRRAVLKTATGAEQQAPQTQTQPPEEEKAAAPAQPVDEKEITKLACQAVGKFFTEAEASVRASGPSVAEAKMRKALEHMKSVLEEYAKTHRVSKLLNIYEGLTWDTYVAVQLRHSVQGNEEFLKKLQGHRQKYRDTCPKE